MGESDPGNNIEVLIIGGDSVIGNALADAYTREGIDVWKTTRNTSAVNNRCFFLDMAADLPLASFPAKHIKLAFICAGITSIAACNAEPAKTKRVNVEKTLAIAEHFVEQGAFVVFLSSNAVFDGELAFSNTDEPTNPPTEYGKQKAEAEKKLMAMDKPGLAILRLNKVIHPKWPILIQWVSDLKNGHTIYPFADMVMAPVSVGSAVSVLKKIGGQRAPGIYQLSADRDISYEDAAIHIAECLGVSRKLIVPVSCQTAGLPKPQKHTTLNCNSVQQLGFDIPHPFMAFDKFIN